jgi:hypothetical protein
MPLIQTAIALMYGRPSDETEVGFQQLNGSKIATRLYSERQIRRAQYKFMALGRIVRGIAKANKPHGTATGGSSKVILSNEGTAL